MFGEEFNGMNKNTKNTIEISLPAVLIIVVLFSVFMFNDGIQEFTDSVLTAKNNSELTDDIKNKCINTYTTQAQKIINKYKKTVPQTELQKEELAKAATIAKIAGKLSESDENFVYLTYQINVNTLTHTTDIGDKKRLSYNKKELYLKTDENKLAAIKEIVAKRFS